MLGNKVSPASLYTDTSSVPTDAVSCGEESQHSQASLFGSNDALSSLELFSQSANSSQSQAMLSQPIEHTQRSVANGSIQPSISTVNHTYSSQNQNQGRNGQKYYMRYLSSVSLAKTKSRSSTNETPLCSENRAASIACSNASYDVWKGKQQDRLERHMIVDEVVKATKGATKELFDGMESLKKELRSIVSEEMTHKSKNDQESLLTDQQTRSIFAQLMQGQSEIKQQLSDIQRQLTMERTEREKLSSQLTSMETTLVETVTSTVEKQVQTFISNSLETAISKSLNGILQSVSSKSNHAESEGVRPCVSNMGCNTAESLPSGTAPSPCDQAVPTVIGIDGNLNSNVMLDDTAKTTVTTRGSELHVPTHTKVQPKNASTQSVSVEPRNEQVVLNPTQSYSTQGSVSTPCDIDLTQQSPSVCSQVISQHLERTANQKVGNTQWNKAVVNSRTASGTSKQGPPPRKKVTRTKAKGNGKQALSSNTNGRSRGATKQTVGARRRSQRVSKQKTYKVERDENVSSDSDSIRSIGSYGGSAGGLCRRVSKSSASVRDNGKIATTGLRELPHGISFASPMNALDDSFYSQAAVGTEPFCLSLVATQTTCTSSAVSWPNSVAPRNSKEQVQSQPSMISNGHTRSDKFQRSSEAARRRKRVIAELSTSDPVLQEISESIRQQKMFKSEPS